MVICDIENWMKKKKLKLNNGKTEAMIIGSKHQTDKYSDFKNISVSGEDVELSSSLKDLGFIVDKNLTCKEQIKKTINTANHSLRNIAFIKKYLDEDSMKKLVHNLIVGRLDYCNALYYDLPACDLRKLQMVLKRSARLITGITRRERITPILIDLHWLPVKARIEFKICVLTFNAISTGKPKYFKKMLENPNVRSDVRIGHVRDHHRLYEPRYNKNIGKRSFKNCAPRLYNRLPSEIKDAKSTVVFRKKLKTYLFEKCYNLDDNTITEQYKL